MRNIRRALVVIFLVLFLSDIAAAASFGGFLRKVFTGEGGRRTSAVAGCVASMFDQQTTFRALSLGGRELNPLFYSNGTFHTNRFITVKVGMCGGMLVGEELVRKIPVVYRHRESYDKAVTAANWVTTGIVGGVAAHNQYVIKTVLEK